MVRLMTAAALALALAACAAQETTPPQPSFYKSLAAPDAQVDSAAAA